MGVEKALELSVLRSAFFAEPGHANSRAADIVYRSDAGIHEQPVCRVDQIRSEVIKDTLQCFIEFELFPGGRMGGVNLGVDFAKQRNFPAKHTNVEKLGFESVIEVGGVVCDFIDAIDELSFEGRAQIKKIFGKLRKFRGGIIIAGMDDAVAVTRVGAAVGMRRLRKTPAARLLRAHRPRSRSGRSIDGPLRSVPADPREGSFSKQIRISAKAWPSRDRLHRRRWCPGIPS